MISTEPSGGSRPVWRFAALAAGIPALPLLGYGIVFLVAGFPISLLLPFAVPVIAVSFAQVRASMRTWQGVPSAAARLRNLSLGVSVALAGLMALALMRGDDGVQRDDALLREQAVEKAIVVALMGADALAFSLLVRSTTRPRVDATVVIARAAGGVLALAVLVVLFWPRPQ